MERADVLVGPQGTLYGAGSLGGIIRLVPKMPDSGAVQASAALGVSATRSGGLGGDAAAMVNLPIVEGHAAMRLVAYGSREAGYKIGRAHVCTPVTNAQLVCRLLFG